MSDRSEAIRLAIYLDTAGFVPHCPKCRTWDDMVAALSLQFFALPAEVRRDAKRHARTILGQASLIEIGRAILPGHPLFNEIADNSSGPPRPKCCHCRKPAWDSREEAMDFCSKSATAGLQPFPCPVHERRWHIALNRNSMHV